MVTPSVTFLLATFLRGIMYGIYMITLTHSLRWLICEDEGWKIRSQEKVQWTMLIVTLLLFVISAADLVITLRLALESVAGQKFVSSMLVMVIGGLELATMLLTDGILIYRCWLVYGKSIRIIIIPTMLWLSGVTSSILFQYWGITDVEELGHMYSFSPRTWNALATFFCCTLSNNIYATCAISYRILSIARNNRSRCLYVTFRIFAESGILCASTTLLVVIASFIGGNEMLAVLTGTINFNMTGIAFNLILIRVGQQRAQGTVDYQERRWYMDDEVAEDNIVSAKEVKGIIVRVMMNRSDERVTQ